MSSTVISISRTESVETAVDVDISVRVDYETIINEFEYFLSLGYTKQVALDKLSSQQIGVSEA
jgi:hypothetical protein